MIDILFGSLLPKSALREKQALCFSRRVMVEKPIKIGVRANAQIKLAIIVMTLYNGSH